MQITRNNYEEYFLLYIDGELSKADHAAVEQFVQLHPDLEEELELLKESILSVDSLVEMPGKALMMKSVEWQDEDLTPARENLILYLDNELPAAAVSALEQQLQTDISLQADFASLQKARLEPALIEMPYKEELYRYQTVGRTIPMWTRWVAAAAAILGVGWFSLSTISNQDKPGTNPGFAVVDPSNKIITPAEKTGATKEESVNKTTPNKATVQYAVTDVEPEKKSATVAAVNTSKVAVSKKAATTSEYAVAKNINQDIAVVLPPTGVREGRQADPRKIGAPKDVDVTIPVATLAYNEDLSTRNTYTNQESSPYQYASYDAGMEEESDYVNIAGAHINKQKLRSVFRNVTRTVTRSFDKSTVTEASVASL